MHSSDPFSVALPAGTVLRHVSTCANIEWSSEKLAWFSSGARYDFLIQGLNHSLPKWIANLHFKLLGFSILGRLNTSDDQLEQFTAIPLIVRQDEQLYEHTYELNAAYSVVAVIHETTQNVFWEKASSDVFGQSLASRSSVSYIRHDGQSGLTACLFPDERLRLVDTKPVTLSSVIGASSKPTPFDIVVGLMQRTDSAFKRRAYWKMLQAEPEVMFKREQFRLASKAYSPVATSADTIRIWSWNVHLWLGSDEKVRKRTFFQRACFGSDSIRFLNCPENADVICLQEVVVHPAFIKRHFKHWNTVIFAPTMRLGFGFQFGNLILSKFSCEHSETVSLGTDPIKREQRNLILAQLNTPAGLLTVACTHLDVWDKTGATRQQMLEKIATVIEEAGAKVILCGDFNDAPKNLPSVANLTHHTLAQNKTCWYQTEVDHVYSKGIEHYGSRTVPVIGSDHWLIETDIDASQM